VETTPFFLKPEDCKNILTTEELRLKMYKNAVLIFYSVGSSKWGRVNSAGEGEGALRKKGNRKKRGKCRMNKGRRKDKGGPVFTHKPPVLTPNRQSLSLPYPPVAPHSLNYL
jgi:hypothetical protein